MSLPCLRPRPRLIAHPSTPSPRLGYTSGQNATISALQSCIEYVDRIDDVCKEILQIRTHFEELLATCQSGVTVGGSSAFNGTVGVQAIGDNEPQTIALVALDMLDVIPPSLTSLDLSPLPRPLARHVQHLDQEYGPLESVSVAGSLSDAIDPPVGQGKFAVFAAFPSNAYHLRPDPGLWLCGASGFIGYELGAQTTLPQHGTYFEGQTLPDSSVRRDQLPLPKVQGSQDKVKCTWPGCLRVFKKDNHTRHVNDTHLRKVKAVCVGCGKKFTRSYMKRDHVCRVRC
ncbi:uncharacterized protein EDB91DRAFT_1091809 [Suillus paluster]|uniref:uncharacterized protein n=1 Tax=Suillus paluster TaxID=48578 RepID=UPI001B8778C1|nr:uncharacterized protein EDB91DRAFT_1091809 [Suillus paluster]KAG1756302.1 hypothetical protein EDB91DRAFT_1091809 [Suillus paluster]